MPNIVGLLRSYPAITGGTLAHKYLKHKLLDLSEETAAELYDEQPALLTEMSEMLRQIEETFSDGYDPGIYVQELACLQALDHDLRERLQIAVHREYTERFRPSNRLCNLRDSAAAFLKALQEWHFQVAGGGVNDESAPLWKALRDEAACLRELLEDRELATRWIP